MPKTTIKKGVVLSDIHAPFHDVNTLCALRSFLVWYKPDLLVFNGDLIDCYNHSFFNKSPNRTRGGIQREFDVTNMLIQFLIKGLTDTEVVHVIGNHEYRFWRSLIESDKFFTIRDLNFKQLLGLDELGVKFETGSLLYHNLLIKHGYRTTVHVANTELTSELVSGTSGHAHRSQLIFKTTRDREMFWLSTGHLSDINQVDYVNIKANAVNWQQSFGIFYFCDNPTFVQPMLVPIQDSNFIVDGKLWKPTKQQQDAYQRAMDKLPDVESYYEREM